jgi:hypothetical protein
MSLDEHDHVKAAVIATKAAGDRFITRPPVLHSTPGCSVSVSISVPADRDCLQGTIRIRTLGGHARRVPCGSRAGWPCCVTSCVTMHRDKGDRCRLQTYAIALRADLSAPAAVPERKLASRPRQCPQQCPRHATLLAIRQRKVSRAAINVTLCPAKFAAHQRRHTPDAMLYLAERPTWAAFASREAGVQIRQLHPARFKSLVGAAVLGSNRVLLSRDRHLPGWWSYAG